MTSLQFKAVQHCLSRKHIFVASNLRIIQKTWIRCCSSDYKHSKIGKFVQQQPRLGNQFTEDIPLNNYLKRIVPQQVLQEITPDLERFGNRVSTDLFDLHNQCEQNPPYLRQYDAWGNRIDEVVTCDAWRKMKSVSAEEGLVSIAYERQFSEWSRLYQIAKFYLYSPSSGLYSCPLAMTDGAARILEVINNKGLKAKAYSRLTSRDPDKFWTSGQWMTERAGGSDVAQGTDTRAEFQKDGSYKLYGYKWFTSASDADMTLTLARVVNPDGSVTHGTKGISMFYLETRDSTGKLNGIQIQKLKNKLGTRQLPTAELLLDGTVAYKVSEEGRGVARISTMLTITRIYNSLYSVSNMRRILALARDYSTKRTAFGQVINNYSLHMQTLARMEIETRGCLLLVLELARLLGREECEVASDRDKLLLRLLTPVSKLYTAKQAVAVASEGLECFGGQGYIEDTGLPLILRDSQVLPIWEGTTNILSLDVLRSMATSQGKVLEAFCDDVRDRINPASKIKELELACINVRNAVDDIVQFSSKNEQYLKDAARDFAFSLAKTYIGALLVDTASHKDASVLDTYVATRWCEQNLVPVKTFHQNKHYDSAATMNDYSIVMEGFQQ